MSDNWVVQHLANTLNTWNEKLGEVWQLLTMSPSAFKGGGIWKVILTINGSLQAIGLALLVLFFLVGVVKTSANLTEVKRPEHALKLFIPYDTVNKDFDSKQEAMAWMIDNQLGRRNISAVDRILLAQKKTALLEQQARENQKLGGRLKSDINSGSSSEAFDNIDKSSDEEFTAINIRRETADLAGVSEGTVAKVMKIQKEHPDLLDNVRRGEMSINRAYKSVVPHLSYASGENEWYTQPQYIEMARSVMGSIDVDPATSDVAQEWIKAAIYYTADDNGLDKDWYGNVWLNPPYAADLLPRFTEKLQHEIREQHVNQAIVLVNNATETKWFATLIKESDALCFAHGRTRFIKSLEDEPRSPMQGQAFIYFGNNVDSFAAVFSEIGEIVVPYRPRLQD